MLVLSRKLNEKIVIAEDVIITVVEIDRGKIKLGIEAPRDVPIYRQELLPIADQRQAPAEPTSAQHECLGCHEFFAESIAPVSVPETENPLRDPR